MFGTGRVFSRTIYKYMNWCLSAVYIHTHWTPCNTNGFRGTCFQGIDWWNPNAHIQCCVLHCRVIYINVTRGGKDIQERTPIGTNDILALLPLFYFFTRFLVDSKWTGDSMASNIYTPMRFIQTLARRSFIYKNRYIEDHQRSFSAPSFPPISVEQQEIQNTSVQS